MDNSTAMVLCFVRVVYKNSFWCLRDVCDESESDSSVVLDTSPVVMHGTRMFTGVHMHTHTHTQ